MRYTFLSSAGRRLLAGDQSCQSLKYLPVAWNHFWMTLFPSHDAVKSSHGRTAQRALYNRWALLPKQDSDAIATTGSLSSPHLSAGCTPAITKAIDWWEKRENLRLTTTGGCATMRPPDCPDCNQVNLVSHHAPFEGVVCASVIPAS